MQLIQRERNRVEIQFKSLFDFSLFLTGTGECGQTPKRQVFAPLLAGLGIFQNHDIYDDNNQKMVIVILIMMGILTRK